MALWLGDISSLASPLKSPYYLRALFSPETKSEEAVIRDSGILLRDLELFFSADEAFTTVLYLSCVAPPSFIINSKKNLLGFHIHEVFIYMSF